jgi:hypothetical protein
LRYNDRMRKLLALLLFTGIASAQDYPYDEVPPPLGANKELPKETPPEELPPASEGPSGKKEKRPENLFRVGLKAGGNFMIYQQDLGTGIGTPFSQNGMGFEGFLSLGWDFAYQPLFLEFQTGYRNLLLTNSIGPLHVIPMQLGIFYRNRIGRRNLVKPGVAASLDLRINDDGVGGNRFAVVPSFQISVIWEISAFLLEPAITIMRIQGANNQLVFSTRAGVRF